MNMYFICDHCQAKKKDPYIESREFPPGWIFKRCGNYCSVSCMNREEEKMEIAAMTEGLNRKPGFSRLAQKQREYLAHHGMLG